VDYNSVMANINDLSKLGVIGVWENVVPRKGNPAKIYRFGTVSLTFAGDVAVTKLKHLIESCWKSDRDTFQRYAEESVEGVLIDLIYNVKVSGQEVSVEKVRNIIDELKSCASESWEVIRVLNGAQLNSPEPLELGPYTLYAYNRDNNYLRSKYPHADNVLHLQFHELDPNAVLIGYTVSTVDDARAIDLSEDAFRQFENVVRYMVGPEKRHDIGIFDYHHFKHRTAATLSPSSAGGQNDLEGAFYPVQLNDPYFVNEDLGHDWIWRTIQKTQMTNLERRVLAGIEWYGKAVRDPETAKFMFALEAVLTFKEKDILVSPSVANQICEFAAFIVGSDYETRSKVENDIKELYGIRSAIVHGGSKVVKTQDIYKAGVLIKALIVSLTTKQDFRSLTSIGQLQQWVKSKRYG
jgi:hypothetical protein